MNNIPQALLTLGILQPKLTGWPRIKYALLAPVYGAVAFLVG